ncbi:TraB/GumN family protein [Leeia sp. TBRC 13508]|uniref:TraB/GumN family protein n=1 Tax=Leeia speluncae TaxID=2884804 RepID=A0ABS8D8K9_9NEIS|nr:TraB/GumN family protein [Leeia speluncae]MCB6184504.1 TraB/GumN family protein [Leeia speluncae]
MRLFKHLKLDLTKTILLGMVFFIANAAFAKPLYLWQVKGPKATVWLFGSVHVGKKDFYPLPQTVMNAFNQSDALAVEVNILQPDMSPEEILKKSILPSGDSLEKHLGTQNWKMLAEALPKQYQIQPDRIQRMRPWMLASTLSMIQIHKMGYEEAYGVDLHLLNQAVRSQKKIISLESMAFQFKQLSSLSDETMSTWLMALVNPDIQNQSKDELTTIIKAWKEGNPDAIRLEKLAYKQGMTDKTMQDFEQKLLRERNPAITKKVIGFLKGNQTIFVAVGAMHYAGDDSIIAQLKKAGYTVIQQTD